ncbi:D-glycerate 3-kinase [Coprinopsis marcescibilis]|uniref:D-glycerate 3-kinase n=1 Tax=Coprinopsis marcescibilis TaxID=230819 RepID=A0A5C3KRV7_COPMA|nr:D-glycerate 3-kinase [Coprinopsis marcescibilis]
MMSVIGAVKNYIRLRHSLTTAKPLLVALQGPQGSGKSFVSAEVQKEMATDPNPLRVVVLSIDDFYLPHMGLVELANQYSRNRLLHGRGQPGTHDVQLACRVLTSLKQHASETQLPSFDKSRFNGQGDRLPPGESPLIHQPPVIDVVLFEGWCVGFHPIIAEELEAQWKTWEEERRKLEIQEDICSKADIVKISKYLQGYKELWGLFDVLIKFGLPPATPDDGSAYKIIYQWRLEQEHYMKSLRNQGMSDDEVKMFIDRYIPGYVFFGTTAQDFGNGSGLFPGGCLDLTLGLERQLLRSKERV